jgi:hypothetical protein
MCCSCSRLRTRALALRRSGVGIYRMVGEAATPKLGWGRRCSGCPVRPSGGGRIGGGIARAIKSGGCGSRRVVGWVCLPAAAPAVAR